jgi:DnaJ-domain-containing protein 1
VPHCAMHDDIAEWDAQIKEQTRKQFAAAFERRKQGKASARELRAELNEALTERDNARGDMLRAFLKA